MRDRPYELLQVLKIRYPDFATESGGQLPVVVFLDFWNTFAKHDFLLQKSPFLSLAVGSRLQNKALSRDRCSKNQRICALTESYKIRPMVCWGEVRDW